MSASSVFNLNSDQSHNSTSRGENDSSAPRPTDNGNVLKPAFVDGVANMFGFTAENDKDIRTSMHDFAKLSAVDKSGGVAHLYILATISSLIQGQRTLIESTKHMQDMCQAITMQMNDNFSLTNDQKSTIRIITHDKMYDHTFMTFMHLHLDVLACLQTNMTEYHFATVFGQPCREHVLGTAVKNQCRYSRNAFRQMLRDSVIGDNTLTLDDFIHVLATRFKRGGPGRNVKPLERARVSILRRFTFDNPLLVSNELLSTTDPDHEDPTSSPLISAPRAYGFAAHISY
ncbi:hypothetical protein BD779DRAFT_1670784 [Infundibulicybe gibba]|nr:hypothetical protein BD779DRAFT_1670784 [Infundibulicybe gibba]